MSLDLYAGGLSRYYSRQFETPQARFARDQNLDYKLVYSGDMPTWFDTEKAPAAIAGFRKKVAGIANQTFAADWQDDVADYFCEQLFEEARMALVLVAAYLKRDDLIRPLKMPLQPELDTAYSDAVTKNYYLGTMAILEATMWLPSEEPVIFRTTDPMGWEMIVSTTGNLKKSLQGLASTVWHDQIDVESWFSRGLAPGKGNTMQQRRNRMPWQSKFVEVAEIEPENSLMWNAEYAFSVFWKATEFAERHHCPVRIDT